MASKVAKGAVYQRQINAVRPLHSILRGKPMTDACPRQAQGGRHLIVIPFQNIGADTPFEKFRVSLNIGHQVKDLLDGMCQQRTSFNHSNYRSVPKSPSGRCRSDHTADEPRHAHRRDHPSHEPPPQTKQPPRLAIQLSPQNRARQLPPNKQSHRQ